MNCAAFYARLQECEDHINATYNVEGLCNGFVKRLEDLKAR